MRSGPRWRPDLLSAADAALGRQRVHPEIGARTTTKTSRLARAVHPSGGRRPARFGRTNIRSPPPRCWHITTLSRPGTARRERLYCSPCTPATTARALHPCRATPGGPRFRPATDAMGLAGGVGNGRRSSHVVDGCRRPPAQTGDFGVMHGFTGRRPRHARLTAGRADPQAPRQKRSRRTSRAPLETGGVGRLALDANPPARQQVRDFHRGVAEGSIGGCLGEAWGGQR